MKTMRDSSGHDVPLKYVQKYDRVRDAAAKKILARFKKARADLERLVRDSLAEMETVRGAAGEGDRAGGDKGNYQFTSFDGLVCVSIRQSYNVMLDERAIRARDLMFEYASELVGKIEGTDGAALMEIIRNAFEANKAGALPYAKVLGLMRLNITAKKWLEAKELLADSIKPERGKCYLHCSERSDTQHDFRLVRLDLADCWPVNG